MSVEKLYLQAKESLEHANFARAAELGEQLIRMRFSGGYEVLARSFAGRAEYGLALTVLKQAVREAPSVWSLWAELGNAHSQLQGFEEALTAYRKARRCPGADLEQLDLNEAILAFRQNRPKRASELLDDLLSNSKDPQVRLAALTHQLKHLARQDRVLEALVIMGEAQLHDHDNAEIMTALGEIVLARGQPAEALRLAEQALGIRDSETARRVVEVARDQLENP